MLLPCTPHRSQFFLKSRDSEPINDVLDNKQTQEQRRVYGSHADVSYELRRGCRAARAELPEPGAALGPSHTELDSKQAQEQTLVCLAAVREQLETVRARRDSATILPWIPSCNCTSSLISCAKRPQVLEEAQTRLQAVVRERLEDARGRRDHATILRFTRLFPLLGMPARPCCFFIYRTGVIVSVLTCTHTFLCR